MHGEERSSSSTTKRACASSSRSCSRRRATRSRPCRSGDEALKRARETSFDVGDHRHQDAADATGSRSLGPQGDRPVAAGHHPDRVRVAEDGDRRREPRRVPVPEKSAKNDEIKLVVKNALEMRTAQGGERAPQATSSSARHDEKKIIGTAKRSSGCSSWWTTGGRQRLHDPHHGRERHGQGADRAGDPLPSRPREGPFVSINCGALPEDLLESELFGHVKGRSRAPCATRTASSPSPTGGTFFLDEIGETHAGDPGEAPARAAGARDHPGRRHEADRRSTCASSRRRTPISRTRGRRGPLPRRPLLPPQRDPDLHAAAARAPRGHPAAGRPLPEGAATAAGAEDDHARRRSSSLLRYDWPGNVRELENIIERSVILDERTIARRRGLAREDPQALVAGRKPHARLAAPVARGGRAATT